jgi:hypothetical protein
LGDVKVVCPAEVYLKKLKILPLLSQYILSLLMFVINNKGLFLTNSNHNISTRQAYNLHLPQANLTLYQKGVHYSGIKIFNSLPIEIKNSSNNRKSFKRALKHFLYQHCFYTLDEYFNR